MIESSGPKISVIVPSFNTSKYLEETIKTVLDQSYANWEIIIIDGGSSDDTIAILNKISSRDNRVKFISEKDEGPFDAIHKGLAMAEGEFISILALSDGYFDNNWFQKSIELMVCDRTLSLVWGIPLEMSEEGSVIGPSHMYAHFLRDAMIDDNKRNTAFLIKKILRRVHLTNLVSVGVFLRKINLENIRTFLNMRTKMDTPQKDSWFRYWLKTGQIFPDGNMIVSKKVLLECMPEHERGRGTPGDWMGFYYNFNTRGYLAKCIPEPVSFGRVHGGQISEVWSEYNDKNRRDYFKRLSSFRRSLKNGKINFSFRDRGGKEIENIKWKN